MTIPQETRKAPESGPKSRIQRVLRLSPLFERASRSTRETALGVAELDVVPGGTVILSQGAPVQALLLLGRGRARIERIAGSASVPLGYRGPGEVLGESCLGGANEHTEKVTAMEEAETVRIPIAPLRELSASDPALGMASLALLTARQRETEDRIESMLFRNVEGRLAEFLIKAADRWGVPVPKGTLISAPITHLEIANSIGSTRETVTVTLGKLRREGLLDVAGRRLIVRDREALAARG